MGKLNRKFYIQKTTKVAKELLGKKLVHIYKGKRLEVMITEVEAYLGVNDKACHTYGGRKTKRVEPMYLEGGHAYVYLIYGMHYCFNVVTEKNGVPEAVLIRAVKPISGVNKAKATDGPGKLCKALKITKKLDGASLLGKEIFIEEYKRISPYKIKKGPRIGIEYAGRDAKLPLRFYLQD